MPLNMYTSSMCMSLPRVCPSVYVSLHVYILFVCVVCIHLCVCPLCVCACYVYVTNCVCTSVCMSFCTYILSVGMFPLCMSLRVRVTLGVCHSVCVYLRSFYVSISSVCMSPACVYPFMYMPLCVYVFCVYFFHVYPSFICVLTSLLAGLTNRPSSKPGWPIQ